MQYDIITIFPEFFESVFSYGVISRAIDNNTISINLHDLRKYTTDKHKTVDDKPYGGGGGMLMMPEPISKAFEDVRQTDKKSIVIYTSPTGEKLNDKIVSELSEYEQIVILCGRYEGVDERIKELYVDREISIGDFVLSGGEYAAGIIVDSVSRNIKGVLGNESSADDESFKNGLLEYPQYTRPEKFNDIEVPSVLLSGHHEEVDKWRRKESIKKTFLNMQDLLDESELNTEELEYLGELQKEFSQNFNVYIRIAAG